MSPLLVLGLLGCLVGTSYGAEVCYDDVGCFTDEAPWGGTAERPVAALPQTPEQIGTRFLLFTQKNKYYQEITTDNAILSASNYAGFRRTKFIIPGFLNKRDEDWPQDMCKVMLMLEGVNCIAVEWTRGVQTQYAQAANNGRVVAAQVVNMINTLMGKYKQKGDKFHIIGHSMGAHVAGEVGREIVDLARITGLDPTEPYYQGTDAMVRLDTSDAKFVDVIHTDGLPFSSKLGLGVSEAIGHIDFYPNGGELMPGCKKNSGSPSKLDAIWEGTHPFESCNHERAYQYYSESIIKSHGFVGYSCPDESSFNKGKCFPCVGNNCASMGHNADKFVVPAGSSQMKFFLNTGSAEPFGRYTYSVKLTLAGPVWPNPGFMYLTLNGDLEVTPEFQLYVGSLTPGAVYESFFEAEAELGEVTEAKFRWNNHIFNPMNPKYGASKIELIRGKDGKMFNLCSADRVAENAIQSVLPC